MLIDAHAHLDRYDLLGEGILQAALQEITQHKIYTISNSLDLHSYNRNLEIAEMCDLVLPTFGIHPWDASKYAHRLEELREYIAGSVMVGEIGLDHYFVEDESKYPDQRKVFEFMLASAQEQDKIVNLHTKGAEDNVFELLNRYQIPRAIVHWYSGPLDTFRRFVDRGVYFTIGVELLYSEHIRTIAKMVPLKRLLTETDNPGGPKVYLGEPGMPTLIHNVVQGLAKVRQMTSEEITHVVQTNMLELTRGDPFWKHRAKQLNN